MLRANRSEVFGLVKVGAGQSDQRERERESSVRQRALRHILQLYISSTRVSILHQKHYARRRGSRDSSHLLAHPSRSTAAHICYVDTPEKASQVVPLLGALRHCPLEELHMPRSCAIRAGWAQFRGAEWTNLKIADFSRCFHGEGAEDVLQVLERCQALEEINLEWCRIPGAAWAKLRGAQWAKMKKANFSGCFIDGDGEGAEELLQVLARCEALEELNLYGSQQIPGPAWANVRGAEWAKMKKASFYWSFLRQGDGAEDLLQVLGRCEALEELDLSSCSKIPASAWQQLPDGCWPKLQLRSCDDIPKEHLPRLRGQGSYDHETAGGLGTVVSRLRQSSRLPKTKAPRVLPERRHRPPRRRGQRRAVAPGSMGRQTESRPVRVRILQFELPGISRSHAFAPGGELRSAGGMTPLHCCADKGHQTIVKQLLAARAAVNATSEKGALEQQRALEH
eukprot:Skav209018  [mRNA]  locus=scaffold2629:73011:78728:+ [translate_table: standard]